MKVKQFLKSQTFKCILVLLVIALISGGLLAIASDLLHVSEEERTARAIRSIYGTDVAYETVYDSEMFSFSYDTETGNIEKVYLLADGNYLIKATGKQGYKSGTITLWAIVDVDKITKISIAEYDKQTLMSKFDSKVLADGTQGNVVVSGATYSASAFNNALSAIQSYINDVLHLTTPEGGEE